MIYKFDIDEQQFEVEIASVEKETALVYVNGSPYTVNMENQEAAGPTPIVSRPVSAPAPKAKAPVSHKPAAPAGSGVITAPIPGLILQIKVNVGDSVKAGQLVAIMEAMKMENDILAPVSGTVKEIPVQKGVDVSTGDVIMVIG
jgi:glutaconyl-CoA/methylmalonyl-CoA decarboxylase subunit gamma